MKTALFLIRKWLLLQTTILLFCQAGFTQAYLIHPAAVTYDSKFSLLAIPSKATGVSVFKQFKKALRQQTKKAGGDNSGLVIVGAVLLTIILGFFIFALSYVGAGEGVIALVAILGLTLIIWGSIALLKSMRRKREKSLITPKTGE